MKTVKCIFLWIYLMFSIVFLNAQTLERSVISSAGGVVFDSSCTVSLGFTIGEAIVGTQSFGITNSTIMINQGFWQEMDAAFSCPDKEATVVTTLNPETDFYTGLKQGQKWQIENIDQFKNVTVQIFNRWGAIVFSEDNYEKNEHLWDGGDLPLVTYFYIVNYDDLNGNKQQVIKGWVELTN